MLDFGELLSGAKSAFFARSNQVCYGKAEFSRAFTESKGPFRSWEQIEPKNKTAARAAAGSDSSDCAYRPSNSSKKDHHPCRTISPPSKLSMRESLPPSLSVSSLIRL